MTFSQAAYKNFRMHAGKYMSYFLCSGFSVMIFFMYMTLVFNRDVMDYLHDSKADMIMIMSVSAILIFSAFFINYSHFTFVKSRNKEFGLYLTLGMSRKDISKIILVENFIIALLSSFAGILSGMVFSRIFFLAVVKLLNIPEVNFMLDFRQFAATFAVFSAIFSCVVFFSRFVTSRLEIAELLKEEAKLSEDRLARPAWGIAGLAALVFYLGAIIAYEAFDGKDLLLMELNLFIGFAGAYFLLSGMGSILAAVSRINKNGYYKKLLGISELKAKFPQDKKVVFILSVLAALTMCMISIPVSICIELPKITENFLSSDLVYVEIGGINNIPPGELEAIFKEENFADAEHHRLEFVFADMGAGEYKSGAIVVSENMFEEIFGKGETTGKPAVVPGNARVIRFNTFSGKTVYPEKSLVLRKDNSELKFALQDEFDGNYLAMGSCPADSMVALCEDDYRQVREIAGPDGTGIIHIINVDNWRLTKGLWKKLAAYAENVNNNPLAAYFGITSRIEFYEGAKGIYEMFLFVSCFLAVLTFVASVSVLVLRQYAGVAEKRRKYIKLYRLGIRRSEAVSFIAADMKPSFFLPTVLGFAIGYPQLYTAVGVFMNFYHSDSLNPSIMRNALWVFAAYLLFHAVAYILAKKKIAKEILGRQTAAYSEK
ncbi:MAG: FtsX-like permease family protein [Bacillota bacterium]